MRQAVSFIPQSVTGMGLDAKCGGRKRKRVAAAEGNKRAKQAKMIQLTVEEAKFSATPAAQGKRKMTTFCKPDVEQLCAVLLAKGVPQEDVDGAIKKFAKENALLSQILVHDNKTPIEQVVAQAGKEAGKPITLTDYVRFQLGEGIEKEESDFAAEVAAAVGN